MKYTTIRKHNCFGGSVQFCEHESNTTNTVMKFSCFVPERKPKKAIIWLSGLTCNEENFITKAGAPQLLAESDTMIICPDTSPRGLDLRNEHENYFFGSGAGFYVNATSPNYQKNYQMYDYIKRDVVQLLKDSFSIDKISISGHSMGGHGALVLGLREQDLFSSVSAFAPLVNPTQSVWGQFAFTGYLGDDESKWNNYDSCKLVASGRVRNDTILVDQGTADEFLEKELLSKNFEDACHKNNQSLKLNFREGYDHSYYFVSSFLKSHIEFHLESLNQ